MKRDENGRFVKGSGGRPKGVRNRTTGEAKQAFLDFLNDNVQDLQVYYDALEDPEKKLDFLLKVGNLLIPKPAAEPAKVELPPSAIPPEKQL